MEGSRCALIGVAVWKSGGQRSDSLSRVLKWTAVLRTLWIFSESDKCGCTSKQDFDTLGAKRPFSQSFTLQQMIIKNIRKSFKCSAVRAVVLVSVTVSKHQHSLRLQCELKSSIYSLQCSIINLHPHKHSCLLGLVFVFIAVVTSQFYPAALTHESSVTFSLLFRDKAYWAPSSHSFFLLHASSGCPPLSTCADSHRTPARKRRLTTRETLAHTACVFVTGGCDGSMWRLLLSFAVWSVCCLRCSCGVVMWP